MSTTSSLEPLLVPSKQTLSFPWPHGGEESQNRSTEKVYVHPLSKRSTSCLSLSTKSLEMCTESLGSETGSLVDSNVDEYSEKHVIKEAKTRQVMKKVRHSSSFPPPLTSISGSEGVQVQTHREGGRLVIKAFTYSRSSYFQAERQNGRLRLSLRGGFWGENMKLDDGAKLWSSSRCNDDRSKRLSSLQFCVAIS